MALTKSAGTWTYEDLLSLPDNGTRYEIIEGELYEMPAANLIHARILSNLLRFLLPVIAAIRGQLYTAPVDVFFEGANPVQPDIVIVLAGWKGRSRVRGLEGAPDLVIEVLSPSNRGHDLLMKRALYARAGVREYWIIDPDKRTVEILALDRDAFHAVQITYDEATVISPLLERSSFPLAAIFAGIDDIES
jgi:Uma2 family endonuclease